MIRNLSKLLFLSICLIVFKVNSSVVDDIDDSAVSIDSDMIKTETIERISGSRRILIITNSSGILLKGDFASIILDERLVIRTIVAKLKDGSVGIKVIKIYSEDLYKQLVPGIQIQVLRGDDSYYKKKVQDEEDPDIIKSNEDLFNKTMLDEDITLEEGTRVIKPDNILTLGYGAVEGIDNDESIHRYGQFMGQYAFQVTDNVWAEAVYGQNVISDFPTDGLDTTFMNFTFRAKYTFKTPFYTFLQPYVGYQILRANSPGAGEEDGETGITQLQAEEDLVANLETDGLIFGVTILKRLVPGWFVRADLGTDVLAGGLALEF